MINILIIAYYFPPQNTVAAHRLYSWAKYWSLDQDCKVTVLTTKNVLGDNSLQFNMEGFDVLRAPRNRLHRKVMSAHYSQNNKKKENKKASIGLIDYIFRKLNHFTLKKGIFREIRLPSFADLWKRPALKAIKNEGKTWDVVVSSSHPYVTHSIARYITKKGLAKIWAADFRDPWTDSSLYPGLFPFTLLERKYEQSIFKKADIITTVGNVIASHMAERFGRQIEVVFNGYEKNEATEVPEDSIIRDILERDSVKIVYTGSIYPGFRDPTLLFHALSDLQKAGIDTVRLEVVIAANNKSFVDKKIREFNVQNNITFVGKVSFPEALMLQANADVLLFLESGREEDRGNITGKLFEYLYTMKPIIATGIRSDSEAWKIIQDLNAGILVSNLEEMTGLLTQILGGGLAKTLGRSNIEKYSRKAAADSFISIIKRHL